MNSTFVTTRIRSAIKDKRIVEVEYFRDDEVLPVTCRLVPLDIVYEIRGIAREQGYLIGFEVDIIPGVIEEKHFRQFLIDSIKDIRRTPKTFNPEKPVKLYRMMKRTPTVAWRIQRDWQMN